MFGDVHREFNELPCEALGIALPGNGNRTRRLQQADKASKTAGEK